MLNILTLIAPLFIIMAFGFIAVKSKILEQKTIPILGRFVLYVGLPSLIFSTISRANISEIIDPLFLLAYGGGSLFTYFLFFILFKLILKNTITQAGIKSFGTSCSNSAFIGYPLLLLFFENAPTSAFAMILLFENIILVPLILIVLEFGSRYGEKASLGNTIKTTFLQVAKNPILIAILSGLGFSLLQLPIPEVFDKSISILSHTTAGVALFFIGGSLVGARLKGNMADLSIITCGKLIIHPLAVGLLIWILPSFDKDLQTAAILVSSVTMMGIFPLIGSKYGFGALTSSALLLTTILSFLSMSFIIFYVL